MLEFIIGRAGSGKTTACLNAIKEKLIHSPTGKPLVILLPDHMTFAIERQLALELKDYGGFTRAYVLGMSRLAYQVLMRCGGILHPHLNEIGKELLLSRVLSSTKLSILAKLLANIISQLLYHKSLKNSNFWYQRYYFARYFSAY